MNEPITVTIKNKICARSLMWLNKGAQWAEANASITVNYEPWSCANSKQRSCILAELADNRIELTMHVLTASGVMDIAYNPSLQQHTCKAPAQGQKSTVTVHPEVVHHDIQPDNKSHIVVAASDNVNTLGGGFKATPVVPPTADKRVDPATGFAVSNLEASDGHTVIAGVQQPAASITQDVINEPEEDAQTVKVQFNELCADKKWSEALQLLIDTFGADKITFTTRAIMSMKDYDAVVKKYDLI